MWQMGGLCCTTAVDRCTQRLSGSTAAACTLVRAVGFQHKYMIAVLLVLLRLFQDWLFVCEAPPLGFESSWAGCASGVDNWLQGSAVATLSVASTQPRPNSICALGAACLLACGDTLLLHNCPLLLTVPYMALRLPIFLTV